MRINHRNAAFAAAFSAAVFHAASPANANIITYTYNGTLSSHSFSGLNDPLGMFGPLPIGEGVSLSIVEDTSLGTITSGNALRHLGADIMSFALTINSFTFTGQGFGTLQGNAGVVLVNNQSGNFIVQQISSSAIPLGAPAGTQFQAFMLAAELVSPSLNFFPFTLDQNYDVNLTGAWLGNGILDIGTLNCALDGCDPQDANAIVGDSQLQFNWTSAQAATRVMPVPEPLTVSLFGAGLAGVVAMGRRRKKA